MKWNDAVELFNIPKRKSVADLEHLPPKLKKMFNTWMDDLTYSLYLSGSVGSGKTYAAIAVLKKIYELKKRDWQIYITSFVLDNELLKANRDGGEEYVLQKYKECHVLYIDDLGAQRITDRVIAQYIHIIEWRIDHEQPTIFTSNFKVHELEKNFGDRLASRLAEAEQIVFPKKDYRKGMQFD